MSQRNKLLNRQGALELSIGTIVIIVLAMSMLILGLVLVRNIFGGATDNVERLNKNVEAEINKLFNEDNNLRSYIALPNNAIEIKQGKEKGVGFGISNNLEGESGASRFTYLFKATSVETGCRLTLDQADSYLKLDKSGSFELGPGGDFVKRVVVQPSSSAPLCTISYDLVVTQDGQPYDINYFTLKIIK